MFPAPSSAVQEAVVGHELPRLSVIVGEDPLG
jgi:hypothetical protein